MSNDNPKVLSNTTTLTGERIEPVFSKVWVILFFDKNGKSYVGDEEYEDQGKAQSRIAEIETTMKAHNYFGFLTCEKHGWEIWGGNYSHAMPMPKVG